MKIVKHLLYLIFLISLVGQASAETSKPKKPEIKDLGNQQYSIGNIKIDKKNKKFTISGKVLRHESPLEFLAVTKGGQKAYESLLELDTNAHEFNLACILIGLDTKGSKPSKIHFDPNPVEGDRVDLTVMWTSSGKPIMIKAADLLNTKKPIKDKNYWVYTGSSVTTDGQYMAELDGTIIGFVHDPSSIIEHKVGLGLGDYGTIGASQSAPPVGTFIELEVVKLNQK